MRTQQGSWVYQLTGSAATCMWPTQTQAWQTSSMKEGKGSWCPTPNWKASDDLWTGESLFSLEMQPLRGDRWSYMLKGVRELSGLLKSQKHVDVRGKSSVRKGVDTGGQEMKTIWSKHRYMAWNSQAIHKEIGTPYALEWREGAWIGCVFTSHSLKPC